MLIGISIFIIFYMCICKNKLPVWFYIGALALVVGWLLLMLAPGLHIRNGSGDNSALPTNWSDIEMSAWILKTIFYFVIYIGVMLPLLSISIMALIHMKKNNNTQSFYVVFSFILLGIICAGGGAFMLRWILPPRTWIVFSFFFVIASGFSIQYYLDHIYTDQKKLPKILTLVVILILTIHNVELIRYRTFFSAIFTEIQTQKDAGIKDISVETPFYKISDSFYLRWVDDIFIRDWVMNGMARYYGVDSVRFVDPITKKSYRELYISGKLKVI